MKEVLLCPYNLFLKKSGKVSKNAEFHTDFKTVEKVFKKFTKKSYLQMTKICTFSTFTLVHRTCFAYNFFWCIFVKLYQRIWNQHETLHFLIPFLIFLNFFLGHTSTFFKLEAKCTKYDAKNQKNLLSKCVLHLNFAPIKGPVFLIFF